MILTLEGGKKEPDAELNVQKTSEKGVSVWPGPASEGVSKVFVEQNRDIFPAASSAVHALDPNHGLL